MCLLMSRLGGRSFRLVDAKRFFVQVVAGGRVSARAATHADIAEFAIPALTLEIVRDAQLQKNLCIFQDLR